jgi:hypothetical protein
MENFAASQEIITATAPDLSTKFLFPFGRPAPFIKPTGRDQHFEPTSEYGIAVGCSKGSNGATLVLIPGRGTKPFARADVKRINHVPPMPAVNPAQLPTINTPTDDPTMAEVIFHSSNLTLDGKDEMTSTSPRGTIGFSMFPDVPIHEARPTVPLPIPPPLKGHLHMFERVTRAKS